MDNLAEETIRRLIEFITNASPVIWNAYIKRAYINGIIDISVFILLIIITVIYWKKFFPIICELYANDEYFSEQRNAQERGSIAIASIVVNLMLLIVALIFLHDGILLLVSPELYAIKDIINLVK